jgi:phosphatidylinositol 3-kinase
VGGLSDESKNLLFKFRHTPTLTGNKKALTRFLYCVDWNDQGEVKQVVDLLPTWVAIDIDDALLLLSDDFKNDAVRKLGVSMLSLADDEELQCYLLQLVQAVRYEPELQNIEMDDQEGVEGDSKKSKIGPLATFLIDRASKAQNLSNLLYWYLNVATEDKKFGTQFNRVLEAFLVKLKTTVSSIMITTDLSRWPY